MKKLRLAAILTLLFPLFASAQISVSDVDLKQFYLRLGVGVVYPDDEATSPKEYVLQGSDLYQTTWDIEEDTTWNISWVWRPLSYVGLEILYVGGSDHSL